MSSRDHRFPPSDRSTTVPSTSSGGHAVNRQADFAPEFVVEAKPFRWFHALVLAALGVGLLWLVVTKSFAAYLADVAPEWALKLNPNEPNALLRLADQKLMLIRAAEANAKKIGQFAVAAPAIGNSAKAGSVLQPAAAGKETTTALASDAQTGSLAAAQRKALDEIRKLVERAIPLAPLNARSFAILAELAERDGNMPRALELSKAAMRRSLRESEAIYRLLQASFAAKDHAESLRLADVLLRTRPSTGVAVIPILARLAETPEARDGLKSMLIANPPWRAQFFAGLEGNITDARTPLELFLSLRDTPHPPSTDNLRSYFDLLFRNNLHELAYYTWLQFLSPEQLARAGLLFNGGFEAPPSGLPFDWVIQAGSGVTAGFSALPDADNGRGLYIEFGSGQVQFGGVAQMVMLAPGKYHLKGKYKGEISGRRGMKWRITCAVGKPAVIAETPMVLGPNPKWKEFEVAFEVPANDCRAQRLQLTHDARSASEQLVSGSIWYKEMGVVRLPAPVRAN